MKVLFVDACPRQAQSRTLALAEHFLTALSELRPDAEVKRHCLPEMGLAPIDGDTLALKEALCDAGDWAHPLLRAGRDLSNADAVVVAAPYWDLMFPSLLKVWIEHIWVRRLTFVYRNDQPVGLLRARDAVFLTTAGSHTDGHDWGSLYLEDVMKTLGARRFHRVAAEGLDLYGADTGALMAEARARAREAAEAVALC